MRPLAHTLRGKSLVIGVGHCLTTKLISDGPEKDLVCQVRIKSKTIVPWLGMETVFPGDISLRGKVQELPSAILRIWGKKWFEKWNQPKILILTWALDQAASKALSTIGQFNYMSQLIPFYGLSFLLLGAAKITSMVDHIYGLQRPTPYSHQ